MTVTMITTVTIAGIATGATGIAIAIDRLDWCPTGPTVQGPDQTSGPFYWHVIAKSVRAAGRVAISPTADPFLRLKLLPDEDCPQHADDESVA